MSSNHPVAQPNAAPVSDVPGPQPSPPAIPIDTPAGAREVAAGLMKLKQFDDADRVLRLAIRLFPRQIALYIDYARCARAANRPEEELSRWHLVRHQFPNNGNGYTQGAQALARMKRFSEAEGLLSAGLANLGEDNGLLAERAILAGKAERWTEARDRWRLVEGRMQLDATSLGHYAIALLKTGEVAEAKAQLEAGLERFPRHIGLRIALAETASANAEWLTALNIWRSISEDEPNSPRAIAGLGQASWLYTMHMRESGQELTSSDEGLEAPVDVGLENDATIKKMLTRFESLGRNCEFGLVQRHYGAEPLGLLRWTQTASNTLIAGLRERFEGLGELENTVMEPDASEIWARDTKYGFRFHTFTKAHAGFDLEKFRVKQARHLAYMRQMFLERLEDGNNIYVYVATFGITDSDVDKIYAALSPYPNTKLLIIHRANTLEEIGTVKHKYDGLYFGYVERFGRDRGHWDLDFKGWTNLCTRFLSMVDNTSSSAS